MFRNTLKSRTSKAVDIAFHGNYNSFHGKQDQVRPFSLKP
jgi:hypothetical protein